MAAFEMVCKRLARLENLADHRISRLEAVADHWLRREREREVDKGGDLDSTLMGWDRDVTLVWQRPGWGPKGVNMTWRAMRISAPDDGQPVDPLGKGRLITEAALARLGLSRNPLWIESRGADEMVLYSEVGLHSDFSLLVHAVAEEMLMDAVRQEGATGLRMMGFSIDPHPGVWLEHCTDLRLLGLLGIPSLPEVRLDVGTLRAPTCPAGGSQGCRLLREEPQGRA